MSSKRIRIIPLLALALLLAVAAPPVVLAKNASFQSFGQFSLRDMGLGRYEATDGLGRVLHLVPRGQKPPAGVPGHEVVYVPVRRVAITGGRDTSLLLALDSIYTVVAVTGDDKDWTIPEIKQGLKDGKVLSMGSGMALDYEALVRLKPEVVFTWDQSVIPKLAELGVPVVITYGDEARTLETQVQFARFLAPFFGKIQAAEQYVAHVRGTLTELERKTAGVGKRPMVIWGDIWEKRVLVEPGQSWAAQLIGLSGGDYLFKDVRGTSCLEVSLERFFSTATQADVMFTYRSPMSGIATKADMARTNPALARIKPMTKGRIYFPLAHYHQSGHLMDQVIMEIAAILHPELYPKHKLQFFHQLPDK